MLVSKPFEIDYLYGTWYILYSNFPMWTSGKRQKPSLCYSPRSTSSPYIINDRVAFSKGGAKKQILGYDRHLGNGRFEWKGKGLLAFLRSNWEVIYREEDWMIIYFKKTLFTPEGYDLISKSKQHQESMSIRLKKQSLDLSKIGQE